jgi:transcriptional regulator with XRE-family HTH domain
MNDKLKVAREARGWSVAQITAYLQLGDDSTYRQWEQGKCRPTERNINKLCALLRKSREDLGF